MTRSTFFALILGMVLNSIVSSAHAEEGGRTAPATSREASHQRTTAMKISIRTQHKVITATLADNSTSRDFVSLLPITLTLKDYAATEKVSDLPRRLSTEGAPAGSDPSIGDIAYYSPWGNLAIFYRNFRYSSGLIKLGKIDTGIEELNVSEGSPIQSISIGVKADNARYRRRAQRLPRAAAGSGNKDGSPDTAGTNPPAPA